MSYDDDVIILPGPKPPVSSYFKYSKSNPEAFSREDVVKALTEDKYSHRTKLLISLYISDKKDPDDCLYAAEVLHNIKEEHEYDQTITRIDNAAKLSSDSSHIRGIAEICEICSGSNTFFFG